MDDLSLGRPGRGPGMLRSVGLGSQGILGALSVLSLIAEKLPGYESVQGRLQQLGVDIGTMATVMTVSTILLTCYSFGSNAIDALFHKYCSSSVRIDSGNALFRDFFLWLEEERPEDIRLARALSAKRVPANSTVEIHDYYEHHVRHPDGSGGGYNQVYKVQYLPAAGTKYSFRYKGSQVWLFTETLQEASPSEFTKRETVWLRTYGRSPHVLKSLLEDVVKKSNQMDKNKTIVYYPARGGCMWQRALARPNRPISTVILDEDQKARIVADIEEYSLPATEKWYANRGLPYRRGYLLHGPPGTGKTSLSMSLAGQFNLEVYALSLSAGTLSDEGLANLFSILPSKCIVLLEDVDASGVKRSVEPFEHYPDISHVRYPTAPTHHRSSRAGVSFSGLLNAIDGAASREGRILIMTTNHLERLDGALIRPGRVDMLVPFTFASKPVISSLFQKLYDVHAEDQAGLRMPTDFPDKQAIMQLAKEFSEVVPEGVFTPAEIQGLLLAHKKEPRAALAAAGAWVRERVADTEGLTDVPGLAGVNNERAVFVPFQVEKHHPDIRPRWSNPGSIPENEY